MRSVFLAGRRCARLAVAAVVFSSFFHPATVFAQPTTGGRVRGPTGGVTDGQSAGFDGTSGRLLKVVPDNDSKSVILQEDGVGTEAPNKLNLTDAEFDIGTCTGTAPDRVCPVGINALIQRTTGPINESQLPESLAADNVIRCFGTDSDTCIKHNTTSGKTEISGTPVLAIAPAINADGGIVVPTGKDVALTDAPVATTDAANKAYVDGIIEPYDFMVGTNGNFGTTKWYCNFSGCSTVSTNRRMQVPRAITCTSFKASLSAVTDVGAGTMTLTFTNQTAATSLSCTIAENSATTCVGAGSLAVAADAQVNFTIITATANAGARGITWTAECTVD